MNAAPSGAIPVGSGRLPRNTAIPRFGFRAAIPGAIAPCLRKFLSRSIGLYMSATMRRRPTRAGLEKNCRAKRNGSEPRSALAAAANAHTLGERSLRRRGMAILILSAGIRFPQDRTQKVTVALEYLTSWVMDGNGHARRLRPFPGSSHFRFIPGILRISSMG